MLGLNNGGLKSKSYNNIWDFDASDLTTTESSAVCQLWLKHNTNVTAAQWNDATDNNRHAAQSTSGNQAATDGGGLEFTRANSDHYDLASAISIAENEAFAIFMVLDIEDVTVGSQGLFSENTSVFIEITDADTIRVKSSDNNNISFTPALTSDTKLILTIRRESTSSGQFHIYINGEKVKITNTALGTQRNTEAFALDILGSKNGSANFYGGHIYEVLVYDTGDLMEKEVTGICNYLKGIHSIT